jgi:ribonucleoside-diphosphate reductase alpha chain
MIRVDSSIATLMLDDDKRADINKILANTYTIVKRDGGLVPFRKERIMSALEAAFRDTKKLNSTDACSSEMKKSIEEVCDLVTIQVAKDSSIGALLTVESIQDIVEIKLIEKGHLDVARDYILYREHHKTLRQDSPRNLKILRRDGFTLVRFNPMKIAAAIELGFRDTYKIQGLPSEEILTSIQNLTEQVVNQVVKKTREGNTLDVESIQDLIERTLMAAGFFDVAKDFILYRRERTWQRENKEEEIKKDLPTEEDKSVQFTVTKSDGTTYLMSRAKLRKKIAFACKDYAPLVSIDELVDQSIANFYDGIKESELDLANLMAARAKVELEPTYTYVAANLLLDSIYRETMGVEAQDPHLKQRTKSYFEEYLKKAVSLGRLDPRLLSFDLEKLSAAIDISRDYKFTYLGLQTLYDRYFIHEKGQRLESPQLFWMRVAMGLSLNEGKKKERYAIEFYTILSKFLYVSSTPTLFNAGTLHSQLSSCYLSTVMDDLSHIYKTISDDAQLSKWAGGLGNDWTNVRATGAFIKGTNGNSQGVIPFLKVANDTAVAVNQGGKRKGAMCAYLETWHLDIEDFLELRKNTGDERRRTHDMNTANWIPDLFMKRVVRGEKWTLFSPSDAPDLHHLYGKEFEVRYEEYERKVAQGEISIYKTVDALQLWRKMLGMLFETGHPWLTFKDPSNIRSMQDHAGVVHSSNLCTEILLNTSEQETAVCNLGSINLSEHMTENGLNENLLAETVSIAIRMLDNVIDINFYPIEEAKTSNLRHRPIGLGLMGFQDALYQLGISYASYEAVEFADKSMELLSYHAILSSSKLAKEKGTYSSYKGSKWERGILPIDSISLLIKERGEEFTEMDQTTRLDWTPVRESIKKYGMRNSHTMAIAPTATIANITGVTQSIEPMYKHLFVKSNLSGEFTVVNTYLVNELKTLGLWDAEMLDDLKYFDGSILEIERIPETVKQKYLTAFEIDPDWIIACGSRRQKWIDMGQSLNLYLAQPSGKKLHEMYISSWKRGLKTTYYLRSLGATQIEKSTTDINKRALQPRWMKHASASSRVEVKRTTTPVACSLDGECESCQ